MKYPTLTRIMSIALALMCALMLVSGVQGFGKAAKDLRKDTREYNKLTKFIDTYEQMSEKLKDSETYAQANKELSAQQEQHDSDASKHRADLAEHTATAGGYKMGTDALWEAKAQLAEAEGAYKAGVKMIEDQLGGMDVDTIADIAAQLAPVCTQLAAQCQQLVAQGGMITVPVDPLPSSPVAVLEPQPVDPPGDEPDQENYKNDDGTDNIDAYNSAHLAWAAQKAAYDAYPALKEAYDQNILTHEDEYNKYLEDLDKAVKEQLEYDEQLQAYKADVNDLYAKAAYEYEQIKAQIPADSGITLPDLPGDLTGLAAALNEAGAQLSQVSMLKTAGSSIESGKKEIQGNLENLWYKMGQLDDEEAELKKEQERLTDESAELNEKNQRVEQLKADEKTMISAKVALMKYDEISQKVDAGEELLPAAKAYAESFHRQFTQKHNMHIWVNIISIIGGIASFICVPAAFEKIKNRHILLLPAVFSFLCAAAAYLLNLSAGLGQLYVVMPAMIFVIIYILFAYPKAKVIISAE